MQAILKSDKDGCFFSGCDEGYYCWTLHEKDAKVVDTVADKGLIDVLGRYGPLTSIETSLSRDNEDTGS